MYKFTPTKQHDVIFASDKLAVLHQARNKIKQSFEKDATTASGKYYQLSQTITELVVRTSVVETVIDDNPFISLTPAVVLYNQQDKGLAKNIAVALLKIDKQTEALSKKELEERKQAIEHSELCERMVNDNVGHFTPKDFSGLSISHRLAVQYATEKLHSQPIQQLSHPDLIRVVKWVQSVLQLEGDKRFNSFMFLHRRNGRTNLLPIIIANTDLDIFIEGVVKMATDGTVKYFISTIHYKDEHQVFRQMYLHYLMSGSTQASTTLRLHMGL